MTAAIGLSVLGDLVLEDALGAAVISSVSPSGLAQGATGIIEVTGTYFDLTSTVGFSGGGIIINSTTFVSTTHLRLNLTVLSGAIVSTRTMTVGTSEGAALGLFTVSTGGPELSAPFWIFLIPVW